MRNVVLVGLLSTCLVVACGGEVNVGGSGGHAAGGGGEASVGGSGGHAAGLADGGDAGVCTSSPFVEDCSGCIGETNCGCDVEAGALVQAITQAVVAAYQAKGKLCASSPGLVPTAGPPSLPSSSSPWEYKPGFIEGQDFETGDETTGWRCLGFTHPEPIRCAYSYRAGSEYVGVGVGGPDPGLMGFEVGAQGDSDNDGVRSMYTITGTVDPSTGELVITPMFTHAPLE